MKIFIWGCYWQGNFGDDLMAVIMSKYFLDKGHEIKVFRLPQPLSDEHDLDVCSNVEEGVAWADVVLLGGGAFLQRRFSLVLKMLSSAIRDIYKELEKLYVALEASNKKFAFCSIGSSGASAFEDLDLVVRKILSLGSNQGGSVRLRKDIDLLKHLKPQCRVEFFPDVLLSSYLYVGAIEKVSPQDGKLRIGVNVSRRDRNLVRAMLEWQEKNSERVNLDFVLTHSIDSGIRSEYISPHKRVGSVVHVEPYDFARTLQEFDCIISIKLHLGLVALAGGTAFISYKGQPKTIDQLTDLNLANFIFSRHEVKSILATLDTLLAGNEILSLSQLDRIECLKQEAVKHLPFIEALLFRRV